MDRRLEVIERVLLCQDCDLVNQCNSPVAFSGPAPCDIAVIGEAPDRQDDLAGEPFAGVVGEVVRKQLREVDIDPDQVAFVNTVSCCSSSGAFEIENITACADKKQAQLELIRPKWVLLLGQVALWGQEPKAKPKHIRGRPFWNGAINLATYHPLAAMRNDNLAKAMAEDFELFARIVNGESWFQFVGEKCVVCGALASWFKDGLLRCEEHLTEEGQAHHGLVDEHYQAAKQRLHPQQLSMNEGVAS